MRSVEAQFRKGKLRCVSKGPNRSGIAIIWWQLLLRWRVLYQTLLEDQVEMATTGVNWEHNWRSAALDPAADPRQAGPQS
jgi:hypothetical protein